ncbi:FAD-dependent monooxygenase, partial [Spongiactinospora gelatinilytica]
MLAHPQLRTEELLERHARALGAVIRRGHQVSGMSQDEQGVTLRVSGPDGEYGITADHVLGADGAGSTVRQAAGIDFSGTDSTVFGFLGGVELADPPERPGFGHNEQGGAGGVKCAGAGTPAPAVSGRPGPRSATAARRGSPDTARPGCRWPRSRPARRP